jgi:hypothetical protein
VFCDMTTAGGGWSQLLSLPGTTANATATGSLWTSAAPIGTAGDVNGVVRSGLYATSAFDQLLVTSANGRPSSPVG